MLYQYIGGLIGRKLSFIPFLTIVDHVSYFLPALYGGVPGLIALGRTLRRTSDNLVLHNALLHLASMTLG
jgi:hypothetical protein